MTLLKTVMGPVTPSMARGCPPKKDAMKAEANWMSATEMPAVDAQTSEMPRGWDGV